MHKRDNAQVILQEVCAGPHGGLVFNIRGAHARMGSMFDDAGFVAETLRQSTIAMAHLRHDVPRDWAFLMDRMAFRVHTESLAERPPSTIRIHAKNVVSRGSALNSLLSIVQILSDRQVVATGQGWLRVVSPAIYGRLRAHRPARQPSATRRRAASPVTLTSVPSTSPPTQRWVATIDPEDAYYFDHAADHLPGMAIYEAACAVAALSTSLHNPRVDQFDGSFHAFIELEKTVDLSAGLPQPTQSAGTCLIDIMASSDGQLAMTARIGVSTYAGDGLPTN